MAKRVLIDVTQDDIDNGRECSAWACPIAIAASRTFGCDVAASGYGLAIQEGGRPRQYLFKLSESALERMRRFDIGRGMKPFRFYATPISKEN